MVALKRMQRGGEGSQTGMSINKVTTQASVGISPTCPTVQMCVCVASKVCGGQKCVVCVCGVGCLCGVWVGRVVAGALPYLG